MKARDVMVSPVITVGDNDTVRDVAKLLIAKRISAVPVVNGAGKLVGIVTEADLMRRVGLEPNTPTLGGCPSLWETAPSPQITSSPTR